MQAALVSSLFFSCCAQKNSAEINKTPDWLQKQIENYEAADARNSPGQIQSFQYKDDIVYFVFSPICCDQYSTLYDDAGDKICHPDGGITGKGDGKCADFFEQRTDMKVIWLDERLTQ